MGYGVVLFSLEDFHAQIQKFRAEVIKAEPVGERRVDVACFGGDLELLVLGHALDRPHIVEAVGHLDEYDAHIDDKGAEYFFEVGRLLAFVVVGTI